MATYKKDVEYYCPTQKRWRSTSETNKSLIALAHHYGLILYRYEDTRLQKKIYHMFKEVPDTNRNIGSLKLSNPKHIEVLVKWIRNSTIKKRKDNLSIKELLNKLINV